MSRVSVPKVMLATIGIHLPTDSLRRAPAQLVRNAASYIHQEKVQLHLHQSRKATRIKHKRERERTDKKEGETKRQGRLFLRIHSPSNTCFATIRSKTVRFSKFSQRKSVKDEKLPTYLKWDLKIEDFVPTRSRPDGTVIFRDQEEIEYYEQ